MSQSRGAKPLRGMCTLILGLLLHIAIGGNPLWAINSALRLKWMQAHEPALLAQAPASTFFSFDVPGAASGLANSRVSKSSPADNPR